MVWVKRLPRDGPRAQLAAAIASGANRNGIRPINGCFRDVGRFET